jgi:hypothetical protein
MTGRTTLILGLWTVLAACDGTGSQPGAGPGEPCQFAGHDFQCGSGERLCYAAGKDSSCGGGDLCVGDGQGMTCAFPCKQTSDCTAISATALCMQTCAERLLNGFCVEPTVHSELMSMTCSTAEPGAVGVAGVIH